MLTRFCVKNYKNFKNQINFATCLEFALIYGDCSCGKSNFCKALFDIHTVFGQQVDTPINVDNDLPIYFWYEFIIQGEHVYCEYVRNYRGEIMYMSIQIPELQFTCKLSAIQMLDFLSKVHGAVRAATDPVSEVLDKLISFITQMRLVFFEGTEIMEYNKGNLKQKPELEYKDGVSFLIIDDADLYYKGDLTKLFRSLGEQGTQAFLTAHRTEWIDNDLWRPDGYFLINGDEIKAFDVLSSKFLSKNIDLRKYYNRGGFSKA